MKAIVVFILVLASTLLAQRPKLLWEAQGHYWLTEIVVSQDGRHCGTYGGLSTSDHTAKLWTVFDRTFLTKTSYIDPAPAENDYSSVRGISLSPRGKHIAIHGSRGYGDSMATAPGEVPLPVWVFTLRGSYLERAITWDHSTVAETRDSLDENWKVVQTFLTIRDVTTGDTLRSAAFPGRSLHYPLTSPDNTTVAYFDRLQQEIVFVDVSTAAILGVVNTGKQNQTKAFSLDGTILTTNDADSVIRRWNVATRELMSSLAVQDRAGISNDGQFFCTVPSMDSLAVFRTVDGSYLGSRTDRINGIYPFHEIVGDQRMGPQIASDGTSVRVIYRGIPDRDPFNPLLSEFMTWVATLSAEDKPQQLYAMRGYGSTCLTRNQSLCVLYIDGIIEERNLLTGELTRTLNVNLPSECYAHSFWSTRDQKTFFVTTSKYTNRSPCIPTITQYDAETFAVLRSYTIDTLSQATSFFEAPDGTFYTTRPTNPYLTKFSLATGDTIHFLNDTLSKYRRFTFSPDGKQIALWNGKSVPVIVSTETGQIIKDLGFYVTDVVQFDPTGAVLYLGIPWSTSDPAAGTTYMLYDLGGDTLVGQQGYQRQLHSYAVYNFHWLKDKRTSITHSSGSTYYWENSLGGILIFNPFTETEPSFTPLVSRPGNDLFTHIDGKEYLVVSSYDNSLSVWEIDYTPASVARERMSPQVAAFPNPSQKTASLSFDTGAHDTRFVVSDITGREVAVTYTIDAATNLVTFDVSILPEGIYMVHSPDHPQLSAKFIKAP